MSVRELINVLFGINQDFEVLAYSTDLELCAMGHGDRMFEVIGVSTTPRADLRPGTRVPGLKYAQERPGGQFVAIEVAAA